MSANGKSNAGSLWFVMLLVVALTLTSSLMPASTDHEHGPGLGVVGLTNDTMDERVGRSEDNDERKVRCSLERDGRTVCDVICYLYLGECNDGGRCVCSHSWKDDATPSCLHYHRNTRQTNAACRDACPNLAHGICAYIDGDTNNPFVCHCHQHGRYITLEKAIAMQRNEILCQPIRRWPLNIPPRCRSYACPNQMDGQCATSHHGCFKDLSQCYCPVRDGTWNEMESVWVPLDVANKRFREGSADPCRDQELGHGQRTAECKHFCPEKTEGLCKFVRLAEPSPDQYCFCRVTAADTEYLLTPFEANDIASHECQRVGADSNWAMGDRQADDCAKYPLTRGNELCTDACALVDGFEKGQCLELEGHHTDMRHCFCTIPNTEYNKYVTLAEANNPSPFGTPTSLRRN